MAESTREGVGSQGGGMKRVNFALVFGAGDFVGFVVLNVGPVCVELFARP